MAASETDRRRLIRRLCLAGLLLVALAASGCAGRLVSLPDLGAPSATSPVPSTPWPTPTPEPTRSPTPPPAASLIAPTPDLSWALEASLSQVSYQVPLQTHYVGRTTAVVFFILEGRSAGSLAYWPTSNPAALQAIEFDSDVVQLSLTDLEPATAYTAAVILGDELSGFTQPALDGEAWGPVSWTTLAAVPFPLRVGVMGDLGFGEPVTYDLAEILAGHRPDFVILTGDLVYLAHEQPTPADAFVEKLYKPLAPLLHLAPVYPVVGNHEYDAGARWQGEPFYFKAFPELPAALLSGQVSTGRRDWYALGIDDIQFVFLNTQLLFGVPGAQQQSAWLGQRLEDSRYRAHILAMHVPPRNAGHHALDSNVVRSRWGPLIESSAVPLVLGGHDHNYQRAVHDDVVYVVSGGGSARLYEIDEGASGLQASARESHVVLLEFWPDRIEILALDADGGALDQAVVPRQ